jgi:periplasmic divalent cation tolerance protein
VTALLALCTAPNEDTAAHLARVLVDERLAACVNRIGGARSTYRWQGSIHDEAEVVLLIKTTRERFDALTARLAKLHPYTTPELIAFDAVAGFAPYLTWIDTETTPA